MKSERRMAEEHERKVTLFTEVLVLKCPAAKSVLHVGLTWS